MFQGVGVHVHHLKREKIMTRSEKKRAKTQRIAIIKGQIKIAKKIKDIAKTWAIILTADQRKKNLWGRLGYCENCQMFYCFSYGGGITWCVECIYKNSCLKVIEPIDELIRKECSPCRWKGEDNANTISMYDMRTNQGM
jgi:hypothetical protein